MQDRQQIRATLIELLEADTGENYRDIKEEDSIREGLGLDSVDVVSVVSQIERKLQMRLSHEELLKIVTVGDLLNLIETKVRAQSRAA
jgi:acyl carrier protein